MVKLSATADINRTGFVRYQKYTGRNSTGFLVDFTNEFFYFLKSVFMQFRSRYILSSIGAILIRIL